MRIKERLRQKAYFLIIVLTIVSCDDSKTAKDMEGTWTRSYITPYEDGTKSHIDEQIT